MDTFYGGLLLGGLAAFMLVVFLSALSELRAQRAYAAARAEFLQSRTPALNPGADEVLADFVRWAAEGDAEAMDTLVRWAEQCRNDAH